MERSGLSVVVPVYNLDPYLVEMFRELFLGGIRRNCPPGTELVIVDDCSPMEKETREAAECAAAWSRLVYMRNPVNSGYIKSVNSALAAASGQFILVCNSDTMLTPGALARMISALASSPRAGMAGPVSNGAFSSRLQQSRVHFPPLASFARGELARVEAFGGEMASLAVTPLEAGWLYGFCFLMKRDLYDEVGPLDEAFGFGYVEEIDYAIRARRAGWKIFVAPDAFVYHGGLRRSLPFVQMFSPNASSQTARNFPFRSLLRIFRGLYALVRKYGWKAVGVPQDAAGASRRGF